MTQFEYALTGNVFYMGEDLPPIDKLLSSTGCTASKSSGDGTHCHVRKDFASYKASCDRLPSGIERKHHGLRGTGLATLAKVFVDHLASSKKVRQEKLRAAGFEFPDRFFRPLRLLPENKAEELAEIGIKFNGIKIETLFSSKVNEDWHARLINEIWQKAFSVFILSEDRRPASKAGNLHHEYGVASSLLRRDQYCILLDCRKHIEGHVELPSNIADHTIEKRFHNLEEFCLKLHEFMSVLALRVADSLLDSKCERSKSVTACFLSPPPERSAASEQAAPSGTRPREGGGAHWQLQQLRGAGFDFSAMKEQVQGDKKETAYFLALERLLPPLASTLLICKNLAFVRQVCSELRQIIAHYRLLAKSFTSSRRKKDYKAPASALQNALVTASALLQRRSIQLNADHSSANLSDDLDALLGRFREAFRICDKQARAVKLAHYQHHSGSSACDRLKEFAAILEAHVRAGTQIDGTFDKLSDFISRDSNGSQLEPFADQLEGLAVELEKCVSYDTELLSDRMRHISSWVAETSSKSSFLNPPVSILRGLPELVATNINPKEFILIMSRIGVD